MAPHLDKSAAGHPLESSDQRMRRPLRTHGVRLLLLRGAAVAGWENLVCRCGRRPTAAIGGPSLFAAVQASAKSAFSEIWLFEAVTAAKQTATLARTSGSRILYERSSVVEASTRPC